MALVTAIALGTSAIGCQPAIHSAAKEVPSAATEGLLDKMDDARTRQRIAALFATPEMQRALRELSTGVVQGAVEGLSDEQLADRLAPAAGRITDAVITSIATKMESDLAPATEALGRVMTGVVRDATHAAVRAAADEIPKTVGPALEETMTEQMGPALEAMLRDRVMRGAAAGLADPMVRRQLGATAHDLSREVVFGSNDALADLAARQPKQGLLAKLAALFTPIVWIVLAVALAGVAVLAWLMARAGRARRAERAEIRERDINDAVLMTLATAIEASEGRPWADELRDSLRARIGALEPERARERRDGPGSRPRPPRRRTQPA